MHQAMEIKGSKPACEPTERHRQNIQTRSLRRELTTTGQGKKPQGVYPPPPIMGLPENHRGVKAPPFNRFTVGNDNQFSL
jgi:hypothetical protein